MRFKKGFTLAEVLIVLVVIGTIATMTIPSLLKGVNESQWKTSYKKAYNAIVNLFAMEKISGSLPVTASAASTTKLFAMLDQSLSVKNYVVETGYTDGKLYSTSDYKTKADVASTTDWTTIWIVTEDNLAYRLVQGTATGTCGTKDEINAEDSITNALSKSCAAVVVDVNGLSSTPNKFETQVLTTTTGSDVKINDMMVALTGDRYYVFVGYDGATSGNRSKLVTGRITADIK